MFTTNKNHNGFAAVALAGAFCLLLFATPAVTAADKTEPSFVSGPTKASLGAVAEIQVPAGYRFLDGKSTRSLMEASGEPTSGRELGLLQPEARGWSVIFEFSPVGYVKDAEKEKLDADALLNSIKTGTARANEERQRRGSPSLEVIGWEQPPHYDATTQNLEWAIRAESAGRPILNHNTRLLGRKGVMEVVLIVSPDKLAETLPTFKDLLKDYSFKSGERYAEFRPGDKIAKYGLAALIAGGGLAVAAKTGLLAKLGILLAKFWKLLIIGLVAIGAFLKRIFGGRSRET